MKTEQCPETLAYKIQTLGNYPEGSVRRSERGESLESRIYWFNYLEGVYLQVISNAKIQLNDKVVGSIKLSKMQLTIDLLCAVLNMAIFSFWTFFYASKVSILRSVDTLRSLNCITEIVQETKGRKYSLWGLDVVHPCLRLLPFPSTFRSVDTLRSLNWITKTIQETKGCEYSLWGLHVVQPCLKPLIFPSTFPVYHPHSSTHLISHRTHTRETTCQ